MIHRPDELRKGLPMSVGLFTALNIPSRLFYPVVDRIFRIYPLGTERDYES